MLHRRAGRIARPSPARRLNLETLETRDVPAAFTDGNLVILRASQSASNATAAVVEINATDAGQTAVQIISIPGTDTDAIRISGSATSTGYLSLTSDRSLLTFTGANSTNTASNVNTLNPRAVVTLNSEGTIDIATTYTGSSGQQTRSATSIDNSTWFIADQNGIYTNNSTAASPSGNFRAIRSFGGTVYVGSASGTATNVQVSTLSAATGGTVAGLTGLANNSSHQDFYLIQSGTNGTTFDVLYVLSATSNTAGTVSKFSFTDSDGNGSLDTWSANGTHTTSFGGFGLVAADSGDGAELYVTTGQGALTGNSVIKLTDTTGYNTDISITTANNVTLFTTTSNTILKGISFAPKAQNQAPVVTLNGGDVSYTENAASPTILASAATVTDADSANFDTGTLTVAFGANGTDDDRLAIRNEGTGSGQIGVSGSNVTFEGTTIGTFTGGTGTTPLVVTLNANATPSATQALVRNITFANVSENPSTADRTVNFTLTDGDGGTSDTVSRIVTVTAVNDDPIVSAPATASTNEDMALAFSTANGNAISVSDVEAAELSVTLTATNGTLTLGSTTGLTVSGNGTSTVTASGSISDLNTGLNGLTFTPTTNYHGPATVTVSASDNGQTGSGGTLTDSETINVAVSSVDDAPAGTDGSATIDEDTAYTFSAADFGFTDVNDDPANAFAGIVVTTLPTAGALTRDGATVTAGDFITAADLLDGLLVFTPAEHANGTPYATFTFQVRDNGETANGGETTDQSPNTFTLNVNAVNDAPEVTAPMSVSTNEDTDFVFSGSDAISVSDVDAAELSVTLTATNGTLTLGSTTGLTVSGNGTSTVTASGSISDLNTGLNGLTFTPATNYHGPATVTVSASDNGQTGSGGTLTDSEMINVAVSSVDDAPAGTDGSATIDEDTAYTFSAADFGFTDVNDDPANAFAGIVVTTLPTAGALTRDGATVTAGDFITAADLLDGLLVFTPAEHANGTPYATFTFQVRDNGETANGGETTDQSPNTFTLNVDAVNDAPEVMLSQTSVTVTVGTVFAQNGFALFAPGGGADEAGQTVQTYTVTPGNPALFSVAPMIDATGRLTFTASGATGTTTVTVTVTDSGGATSAEVEFTVTVETAPELASPPVPVNVTTDPTARFIAAGADAGSNGTVSLFDARTGAALASFQPFGNFTGGVTVALGDLTGDGTAELIVATRGSIGLLAVYDLATGATLVSPVRPFAGLNTGLQITTADVDGDGVRDLVFSPERGAPTVAGFSFVKGQFVSFANPLPGANLNFQLAAGDVTGDSRAEIILSANGTLAVLDPLGAVLSVIPVVPGFTGEMSIAVGDTNGDGKREIVVALQAPGAATVLAGFSAEGALVWNLFADTGAGLLRDGTNRPAVPDAPSVAVADVTGDGIADILLGSQTGMGTSRITIVNGATQQVARTDVAFGLLSQAGVFTDAG